VPRDLWDRPKKGFEVPLAVWFRGDLYDYLHENLLDNGGLPFTIFNKDTVEKILEDHKSGKRNNYRILWGLLSLAMWYRNYINS
jgi:asparagine synthase (glutamine-hydrolysing)